MIAERIVETICPYCGVGCGMGLQVRDEQVVAVTPLGSHPVSRGHLCTKGWNTPFAINSPMRVTEPLVRHGNSWRPLSWPDALDLVADGLQDIRSREGADALGMISSARATNEDNYAVQKFARAVLGTNNVDHCARICHSPSVAGLRQTLGSGAMTNSVADVHKASLIVVFGADPTENHPIIGGEIMRARRNGARLLVVDPRKTRLARMADIHLQLKIGTNIALINGLLQIIFAEGWQATDFLAERCEGLEELQQKAAEYPPERVAEITGVGVADLRRAAEMYAKADNAFLAYGMGITQFVSGTANVISISNLALSCGQIGRPGTGINPLRGQNNVQGACDMGALPNVYPGYQDTMDVQVQQKFAAAWGVSVSDRPGLTSLGMTQGALAEQVRGMIIHGEDPVVTDPDQNHVRRALRALDLLVVVELNMTETAKMADLVLPAAAFAEKDGTFTNCERRVQRIRAAIAPPGEARGDWQILAMLAWRLGHRGMEWAGASEVFDELAALSPIYSGMSYAGLDEADGLQWPCNESAPKGTPYLHGESFPRGRGRLIAVDYHPPAEEPDAEYPLALTTTRLHFHYGCGSMTRLSPLLERETPPGLLFMHPDDADLLGLHQRDGVAVSSRRGYLETRVMLSDEVTPGLVAMPYHFSEVPSNQLTNNAMDPITKMPELKVCAVRVEPLPPGQAPRPIDDILAESAA